MNVLVVEDEKNLADAIVTIIENAGYHADAIYNGIDAETAIETGLYDVVVLDIMLPGKSGLEVVSELRANNNPTPVLMLTARTSTGDKVEGLDAGADDYMTKPFEAPELLARIRSLSRRRGEVMIDEISYADITLDLGVHDLKCGEKSVHLSGKEFEVMQLLMSSTSRVVPKGDLLSRIWGNDSDASENSVEAYISFLRKKLQHIGSHVQITTLRMLGYRLEMFE